MYGMTVGEILQDFKSIKLSPEKRKFIDACRNCFEQYGDIPWSDKTQVWKMVRHYKRQFDELHASRERAKRTNWRVREGITRDREMQLIDERKREYEGRKADLGI